MSLCSRIKQLAILAGFGILFACISFEATTHREVISAIATSGGAFGIAGFIALTSIFVVFVIPLDIVFLIPIGSVLWGPVPTALMSILGWTIGSAIAFGIARGLGSGVVELLIGLERIRAVEQRIPKRNLFGAVVVMRMLVSVDILSYALGLFSTMGWAPYILATAIGVAPFGFYFSYAGTLPFWYQIIAIALALVLASLVVWRYGIRREP